MKTITDKFEEHLGVREYNGIVRTMIEWYYGGFAKVAWCAISCTYMANQCGILDQFGGKHQNVCEMMHATEKAHKRTGKGTFWYAKDIPAHTVLPRGTVVFILKSDPPMTVTSSKHVTTVYKPFTYTGKGTFQSLGGNQSDYIKVAAYTQKNIYAVYIPDYGEEKPEPKPTPGPKPAPGKHTTLRRGGKGEEVKVLQRWLNTFGYRNQYGNALAVDGSYGPRTEAAVKNLQADQKLKVDGICGPITWGRIDEMDKLIHTVTPTTDVYVRANHGKAYDTVGVLREGVKYKATREADGWTYIADKGGWSKSTYLKTV